MKHVYAFAALVVALSGIIFAQDQVTNIRPRFAIIKPLNPVDPVAYRNNVPVGKSLPIWGAFFMYHNQPYGFYMIGTNPDAGSATSKIKLVLIPVALKF